MNLLKFFCLPLIYYACDAILPKFRDCCVIDKLIDCAVGKTFATYQTTNLNNIRSAFKIPSTHGYLYDRHLSYMARYKCKPLYFARDVYLCGYHEKVSAIYYNT